MRDYRGHSPLVYVASMLLICRPVCGQDAPPPSNVTVLPPIVVTAHEFGAAQSAQFFDKSDLEQTNVQTQTDILKQAANVSVNTSNGFPGTTYTVRGVSENALLLTNDLRPSISQYIDDIPCVDTLSRNTPLLNVASAQFYRGPQETLFGAPSPAGALNIYTAAPTNRWSGSVDYQYGSYEFQQVQTTVNAPLIKDHLYLGFSGNFSEENGFITNTFDGSKVDGDQQRNGLLRLVWKPESDLEISLYGKLGELSQSNYYDQLPFSQLQNPYSLDTDYHGYNNQRYNLQALRVVWHQDGYDLLSVSSRQAQTLSDLENTSSIIHALPLNIVNTGADFRTETYTQEFRATSIDSASDIQWRGGFFYSHRYQDGYNQVDYLHLPFITGMPGTDEGLYINNVTDSDYALYGEATYHPTEKWDLTAGLRGELYDEKRNSGIAVTGIAGALLGGFHSETRPGSLTQETYLPSAKATYHWTDGQSTWLKLDKAWRPGGVGIYQVAPSNYTKESSLNIELGQSMSFWNNKASITPLLYYSHYENYQAPVFVSPTVAYEANAKYATARGAELSLALSPLPHLQFMSNLGYAEARYDEYSGGATTNGSAIPNIPEYTVNNSVSYVYQMTSTTDLMTRMDYNIVGDFYAPTSDSTYRYKQGAYGLLSAKVGYEFPYGGVYLFGANLSDSHYGESLNYYPGLGLYGDPGAPATLGVEVSFNY
jgi:iron complex outermembrane recepter protein